MPRPLQSMHTVRRQQRRYRQSAPTSAATGWLWSAPRTTPVAAKKKARMLPGFWNYTVDHRHYDGPTCLSGLVARRERPSRCRTERRLRSRRRRRSRRRGRRLFCCFLGRWFLGHRLLRSRLLGRSGLLRRRLLGRSGFLRRCLLGRSGLLRWSGLLGRSLLGRSGLFRSCHNDLLDQVAKSTTRLHIVWRFTVRRSVERHSPLIDRPGPVNGDAARAADCVDGCSRVAGLKTSICRPTAGQPCRCLWPVSPTTGRHRSGSRSHGSRRSCVPSSGRSSRSSTGTGSLRSGRESPVRSALHAGSRCSAGNL